MPDLAVPQHGAAAGQRVMIDSVMGASGSAGMHNVPVPLSSLIGRSRELDGIGETLRRTRLVTLTGPGGVGKTRLATEFARRQIGRRRDGIWLVDLTAGGADPDPAAEVARALDVGGSAEIAPTESLSELEVVRLVAEGLANKAIAAHLHLSVRTVESHVRHVLTKAGLNNRTQLATWAREHLQ
jgi:DNA-binding CsgD family transcriptional regulator